MTHKPTTDLRKGPTGKRVDARMNHTGIRLRLPRGYASPEAALRGWMYNRCGMDSKLIRTIRRSVRAGLPFVVELIQREQSPDGRIVHVNILSLDLRNPALLP